MASTSQTHLDLLLALQAYGDGAGSLVQIALGTPGTFQLISNDTKENGLAHTSPGFVEGLLSVIGAYLDNQYTAWVVVGTGATGVAPTISESFGISSVTKNETFNSVKFTFDPPFDTTLSSVPTAMLLVDVAFPVLIGQGTTDLDLAFYDTAGSRIDINNRAIRFSAVGRRNPVVPTSFPPPPARAGGSGGSGGSGK